MTSKILIGVGIGAVILGIAAIIPMLLGFGVGGIAAGSVAARIQSGIGNVAAGSFFAFMTSLGMKAFFVKLAAVSGSFLLSIIGIIIGFFKKIFGKKSKEKSEKTKRSNKSFWCCCSGSIEDKM